MSQFSSWPYPRWIAHRGAGTLAPENTLAALRLGLQHGWRMCECDAKLSADGVLLLLHDDTLERTTNGHGPAASQPWGALAQLDAGSWHSPHYAGEPLPTLHAALRWSLANAALLNIEIKPNPGQAQATGQAVAALVTQVLGQSPHIPHAAPQAAPLLSSFDPQALAAAQATAPQLPRGLLVDSDGPFHPAAVLAQGADLACCALILHYPLWSAALVAQAHAAGLRCLSYTVNDLATAQRLLDWGVDGIISDRVDFFDPTAQDAVIKRAASA